MDELPTEAGRGSSSPDPRETAPDAASSRNRSQRREQAAADVLRTFIRDQHQYRFGAVPPRAENMDIQLRVNVRPNENWALRFAPPLAEQLATQIEDAQAGWEVYRKGRVYCFRCESSDCEHAAPDSSLAVFRSYAPNGVPEWGELAQTLIAARDPRVDRLYDPRGGPVARVQLGSELKDRQLSSFGKSSKTYAVLGQVVAGYFALHSREDNAGKVAVTIQVVEVRGKNGSLCLRLNTLAAFPEEGDIGDRLVGGWQPGLHRALETAMREVGELEQRAGAARESGHSEDARAQLRRVPSVLRGLAESIERSGRQQERRTRHVETRRREMRPVHKALDDARSAGQGALYHDEKAGTTVVCGPQGRAHAFAPDGRHVTSFVLRPEAVAFRLRTRRWRLVTPDEGAQFREQIEKLIPKRETSEG